MMMNIGVCVSLLEYSPCAGFSAQGRRAVFFSPAGRGDARGAVVFWPAGARRPAGRLAGCHGTRVQFLEARGDGRTGRAQGACQGREGLLNGCSVVVFHVRDNTPEGIGVACAYGDRSSD